MALPSNVLAAMLAAQQAQATPAEGMMTYIKASAECVPEGWLGVCLAVE